MVPALDRRAAARGDLTSLLALGVACLAYYRATHRQLPTVYLFATNEDPFDPDWRIRIHNPTPCPIYLKRITIHEPRPDMVQSIAHEGLSIRGTIERRRGHRRRPAYVQHQFRDRMVP